MPRLFRKAYTAVYLLRCQVKWQTIRLLGQIKLGRGSKIEPRARIRITHQSLREYVVEIGRNSIIKDDSYILPRSGFVRMGDNCTLNPFCIILGYGGVTIGNNVRIAAGTSIVAFNHVMDDPDAPILAQGNKCLGIVIEDDVWIGTGVRVLDGVRIGRGAVIGAGSVVTRDIPPETVAVGVPARAIRSRRPIFLEANTGRLA